MSDGGATQRRCAKRSKVRAAFEKVFRAMVTVLGREVKHSMQAASGRIIPPVVQPSDPLRRLFAWVRKTQATQPLLAARILL